MCIRDRCRTSNNKAEEFLKKLELNPKVGYFNAGVILFDLDNIRKKITTQTFFDCLEENREKIVWLDQDVLNLSLIHIFSKSLSFYRAYHK